MRPSKFLFLISAVAALALLSGCATGTHTANGKNHTIILGGLIDYHEGAYEKQPVYTDALNTDKPLPGSDLNGNKISFLWGLFSYRNQ